MKNLSLSLNGILLLAVGVLYFLHFSDKRDREAASAAEIEAGSNGTPANIAFINVDTLFKNYEYYEELNAKLETRKATLEKELQNRVSGFQNEVNNFQQNVNNLTIAQARALQEDLTKKEQNLMQYQQQLTAQLSQEEAKVQLDLYDKIASYLDRYGRDNDFQLVLGYQKGGAVFYASDSLNITQQVLGGLNTDYQQEQLADTVKAEGN
ncbi:MAG: OmpH family outer membrane protein [Cyclobacteriaceae bacterium]